MESFTIHKGIAAPLDRPNVDTDAIIPKQFLRKIDRTGFGVHLFHELRYLDYNGTQENPDFVLNQPQYRNATILLARDNFGCGSSREHAPWALADFGFKVIIAPSFADIFYSNCFKNGMLPVKLNSKDVEELFLWVQNNKGAEIQADLENQKVIANNKEYPFELHSFAKECLLKGLDQIGWTLQFAEQISTYEKELKEKKPWLT